MPSVNLQITPIGGPLIDLLVGISAPRTKALTDAGLPVPAPVSTRFLVDTGASNTRVDPAILSQLSLTPTGSIPIHTPSTGGTPAMCNQFDISLSIPHPCLNRRFPAIAVTEANLSAQGIQGLLGRDILANCLLIYNGEANTFTLSFWIERSAIKLRT